MNIITLLLFVVIVLLLGLVTALVLWRKSDSPARLAKLAAVNATLQSNLEHAQRSMTRLQDQLEPLGRARDECTGLRENLDAARKLNVKIEQAKQAWEDRSNELQQQVQALTAERSALQTKLEHAHQETNLRDTLEQRFKDAFQALSANALKTQGESIQKNTDINAKIHQEAIEKQVRALTEKIDNLDRARIDNASMFKEQMAKMIDGSRELGSVAQTLATALQKPGVRGRWGEIQLERILEMSGLRKGIDYSNQDSFESEGQRLRTDVVVKMPEDRRIILDSKVSLVALLEAFETNDEEQRAQALNRHVDQVKNHVKELAGKEYWKLLQIQTVDLVVMVMPEFAFLPALERDSDLSEWALQKKVVIVTPPTLLALLRAIALMWKQVRVVEKAREISELGKEVHDRLAIFAEHYVAMGKALHQSVERYNKSVNSWDSRVMTKVTLFKDLEVATTKQPPQMATLESSPTAIHKLPELDKG